VQKSAAEKAMLPLAYMGQLALTIAAVIPPPVSAPASMPPLLELLLLDPLLLELLLLDPLPELLLLDPPLLELLLLLDPPLLELLLLDPPDDEPPPLAAPEEELLEPVEASAFVDGVLSLLHPEKAPRPSKANVALNPKAWKGFIFSSCL
jgi:hypothetical protein